MPTDRFVSQSLTITVRSKESPRKRSQKPRGQSKVFIRPTSSQNFSPPLHRAETTSVMSQPPYPATYFNASRRKSRKIIEIIPPSPKRPSSFCSTYFSPPAPSRPFTQPANPSLCALTSTNPFLLPLSNPIYPSTPSPAVPISTRPAQTRQLIGRNSSAPNTKPTQIKSTDMSVSMVMSRGKDEEGEVEVEGPEDEELLAAVDDGG